MAGAGMQGGGIPGAGVQGAGQPGGFSPGQSQVTPQDHEKVREHKGKGETVGAALPVCLSVVGSAPPWLWYAVAALAGHVSDPSFPTGSTDHAGPAADSRPDRHAAPRTAAEHPHSEGTNPEIHGGTLTGDVPNLPPLKQSCLGWDSALLPSVPGSPSSPSFWQAQDGDAMCLHRGDAPWQLLPIATRADGAF